MAVALPSVVLEAQGLLLLEVDEDERLALELALGEQPVEPFFMVEELDGLVEVALVSELVLGEVAERLLGLVDDGFE